jgi:hypothetical protein
MRHAYLSLNLTLPEPDLEEYREVAGHNLSAGGWWLETRRLDWKRWRRGDLLAEFAMWRLHPEDARRGGCYPDGYRHLEIRVWTEGYPYPDGLEQRPWRWFYEVGLRRMLPTGTPKYIEPEELTEHLPAQVELGCGPSTEADVPHLSTLHRIYGVSKPDFSFVFRAMDDSVLNLFADPEEAYRRMTDIYRACAVAEPTFFYRALQERRVRRSSSIRLPAP